MAEANFSWLKIASFIGALVLVVLAFIGIASGINMVLADNAFYGAASIIGGIACGAIAVWVYRNYQEKSLKNRA